MNYRMRTYLLIMVIGFVFPMVFSLFFPGRSIVLDKLRLEIQRPLINSLSHFQIRNAYLSNKLKTSEAESISYSELDKYFQKLEPISLLFTCTKGFASNIFIGGDWKHSAIYLGNHAQIENRFGVNSDIYRMLSPYYKAPQDILILDSSCDGVLVREFKALSNLQSSSFLRSIICFNLQVSENEILTFIKAALKQTGKGFDYDLITHDDSCLYCSELIYSCLKTIGIKIDVRTHFMRRSYISPTDLVTYITEEGIQNQKFSFQLLLKKEKGKLRPFYSRKHKKIQYSNLQKGH